MAPENTMEAFRLGVEAGADAIELDVHLTADGQLAVIHDETLDRTTDRTGPVAEPHDGRDSRGRCGRALRAARTTRAYPFAGRGLRVPTLPEVLEWLPDATGLVIEIKARAAADAVVQAVDGHPAQADGRLSVISFDEAAIDRVRELDPGIRTGYLVAPGQAIDEAFAWASGRGHTGVHPWEGDLGADPLPILAQAKILGLEVGCYVVNDPGRMRFLSDTGLWGFVTDVPDVAVETLGQVLDRLRAGGRELAERLSGANRIVDAERDRDPRALHAGRHDQLDVHAAIGQPSGRRAERSGLVHQPGRDDLAVAVDEVPRPRGPSGPRRHRS